MKYSVFAYLSFFVFFISGLTTLRAQENIVDPVMWSAALTDLQSGSYSLQLTAETEPGWVIYSQFLADDGPIPTTFAVDLPKGAKLIGDFQEPENGVKKMDEMFGMELLKFHGPATFVQKIQSDETLKRLSGTVVYMACDDSKCLPPKEISFVADLPN